MSHANVISAPAVIANPHRPTLPAMNAAAAPQIAAAQRPARGPKRGVIPFTPAARSAATSGTSHNTVFAAMISATAATDAAKVASNRGMPENGSVAVAAVHAAVVRRFFGTTRFMLSAAAAGAQVLLLESDSEIGGTVRQALIHTIAGLFDDQGEFLNAGLPMELTERLTQASPSSQKRRIGKTWVLNADPAVYSETVRRWISETPTVEVCCGARVTKVAADKGVIGEIEYEARGATHAVSPRHLVDATGSASVVRQIDPALVEDGCALGGFIVRIRGLRPCAMQFPKGAGLVREVRRAAQSGELPPACATVWIDTGVRGDEAYAKFNLRHEQFDGARMRETANVLVRFLREMEGFEDAFVEAAADQLPDAFRAVFFARAIEGLSVEETAELLDLKPETVKTRLHRARALLRKRLDEQMGPLFFDAFPFAGRRCERLTAAVMERLGMAD